MHKKNTKIWIGLIIAPFALLIGSAIMQFIVRFMFDLDGSGISVVVNILSFLIGIVGVVLILGLPVWITFLVLAMQHNQKIDKQTQTPPNIQNPTIHQ